MDGIGFEKIDHGSELYRKAVDLRYRVLRKPIGLVFSNNELDAEFDSIHLALIWENQVLACLVLVRKPGGEMKMRQVAVEFEYQAQGLGRRLVCEAEQFSVGLNANLMTLHARDTAVSFYEKLGYLATGSEFLEVGVPHRFMSKSLTDCRRCDTAE